MKAREIRRCSLPSLPNAVRGLANWRPCRGQFGRAIRLPACPSPEVYDRFLVAYRIDPDQDALVIDEQMLVAIAFDVKFTIGIALHWPHRLIWHAAVTIIELHKTTRAQTAQPGVFSSVDVRC